MSETDSFIDEVTEELRRERLTRLFRKWGWLGGVVILGIVGATAWNEWQDARETARAQAFGDALLDALDLGAPEDRLAAIKAAPADGGQAAVVGLLLSSDPTTDRAASLAALEALAADTSQPEVYRDLATLRRVLLAGADMALPDRRGALEAITGPGRPFRVLAQEQLAYLLLEEGRKDEAIAGLTALLDDQEATASMKERLRQVITALGGSLPEAAAG